MNLKFWTTKKNTKNSKRGYDAASKSKRLKSWFASGRSANGETSIALPLLRDRSRDLRRNNAYAAKAIMVLSSNIVGSGIKTQFSEPGFTDKDGPVESAWKAWAGSTDCDYDGQHDFDGLQGLIIEAVAESGEVLVRKRFNSSLDIPLQYQVLESDFLAIHKTGLAPEDGNTIIQGIEFDRQGRRVAYWLYNRHPGGQDKHGLFSNLEAQRIPADEIYHIYRMDRPGQARGIPWGAPCMVRIKDLDDFADATVMRQKVAACFTAFVRDLSTEIADGADDEDCELMERLEPALIEELPAGKTIEFPQLPSPENYKEFNSVELHSVAAGYGITYESLTGDFTDTNFSNGRMGWIEFSRLVKKWQKQIMILKFLDPAVKDFKQVLAISGVNPSAAIHRHVPPRREMIDPTKEVPAIVESIRAGITTLSDEIMAQGKDPNEHLAAYKKDVDQIDKLELTLDSDARKTAKNGRSQDANNNDGGTSETQN